MNSEAVLASFSQDAKFSRKTWGLLSLELWQRTFTTALMNSAIFNSEINLNSQGAMI